MKIWMHFALLMVCRLPKLSVAAEPISKVPTAKWNCTTIGQDAQAWQNNSTAKD
jgi:hypothetical protein